MEIEIDLHGYHPSQITGEVLAKILRQAWESGATEIRLIHGHGRGRGISPGFVNTNTGYLGLCLRGQLRHDDTLRQWIKISTFSCAHAGSTVIGLRRNPSPSRAEIDNDLLPEPAFSRSNRYRPW
jgi:hypothetical protein